MRGVRSCMTAFRTRKTLAAISFLGVACAAAACEDPVDALSRGWPGAAEQPSGDSPASNPVGAPVKVDVAEKPLLRLTTSQYANTLRDALGVTDAPLDLLPEETVDEGFYNHASAQLIDDTLVNGYAKMAEAVAARLVSDTTRRSVLVGCLPTQNAADPCLLSFAARTTKRLYRRPTTQEDVAALVGFAVKGAKDGWAAVQNVLEVALQSPRLLYRFEPAVVEERPGFLRFDSYAMASRLSFAVLNSIPDDELLGLAEQDRLQTPEQVRAQAERLLKLPGAKEGAREFYRQWLVLDPVLKREKDVKAFPGFTPQLLVSARAEVFAVADDLAVSNRPFLDLLVTDRTFVDARLAKLYGLSIPGAQPDVFQPSPVGEGRLGFLTQAGFLANQDTTTATSPTQRGRFVMTHLLCLPNVAPIANGFEDDPTPNVPKTTRQIMEQVHAAGSCQGCHRQMDGIGFGFEGFDAIGARRTQDNGLPIDDASVLVVGAKEIHFKGAVELAKQLRTLPEVEACLVRQNVRWGLGRTLAAGAEGEGAAALANAFAATDRTYGSLVQSLVQSDFFRLRPKS